MSASSMMMTMGSMMTTTTTAPQRPGVGVRRIATPSASFNNDVRSAGGKRRLHHRGSRARLRCDAAAGDGGAGGEDDELFEGDLLANNAASVNGKLRTLVVGITDEQGEAGLGCASSSIVNRPSSIVCVWCTRFQTIRSFRALDHREAPLSTITWFCSVQDDGGGGGVR